MRTCQSKTCGKPLANKRKQAKFCDHKCRSQYRRDRLEGNVVKSKPKIDSSSEKSSYLEGLNNVVEDSPNKNLPMVNPHQVKIEEIEQEVNRLKTLIENKQHAFDLLNMEYQELKKVNPDGNKVAITGAMTLLGLGIATNKSDDPILHGMLGIGIGFLTGRITSGLVKGVRVDQVNQRIQEIPKQQKQLCGEVQALNHEIEQYMQSIKVQQVLSNRLEKKRLEAQKKSISDQKSILTPINKANRPEGIISSLDFMQMQFHSLNFQNQWKIFLGSPDTKFHAVIHGKPGQGKSTFSLLFAKYLSKNFGQVLYLSSEEGLVKTMKDKFEFTQAANKGLDLVSYKSKEMLFEKLKADIYHFIIIDSLNDLKMDIEDVKRFKERHANSAHIHICQSTKEGKMRGSQEIIHECDIEMYVEDGVVSLNKNRFGGIDRELRIF